LSWKYFFKEKFFYFSENLFFRKIKILKKYFSDIFMKRKYTSYGRFFLFTKKRLKLRLIVPKIFIILSLKKNNLFFTIINGYGKILYKYTPGMLGFSGTSKLAFFSIKEVSMKIINFLSIRMKKFFRKTRERKKRLYNKKRFFSKWFFRKRNKNKKIKFFIGMRLYKKKKKLFFIPLLNDLLKKYKKYKFGNNNKNLEKLRFINLKFFFFLKKKFLNKKIYNKFYILKFLNIKILKYKRKENNRRKMINRKKIMLYSKLDLLELKRVIHNKNINLLLFFFGILNKTKTKQNWLEKRKIIILLKLFFFFFLFFKMKIKKNIYLLLLKLKFNKKNLFFFRKKNLKRKKSSNRKKRKWWSKKKRFGNLKKKWFNRFFKKFKWNWSSRIFAVKSKVFDRLRKKIYKFFFIGFRKKLIYNTLNMNRFFYGFFIRKKLRKNYKHKNKYSYNNKFLILKKLFVDLRKEIKSIEIGRRKKREINYISRKLYGRLKKGHRNERLKIFNFFYEKKLKKNSSKINKLMEVKLIKFLKFKLIKKFVFFKLLRKKKKFFFLRKKLFYDPRNNKKFRLRFFSKRKIRKRVFFKIPLCIIYKGIKNFSLKLFLRKTLRKFYIKSISFLNLPKKSFSFRKKKKIRRV